MSIEVTTSVDGLVEIVDLNPGPINFVELQQGPRGTPGPPGPPGGSGGSGVTPELLALINSKAPIDSPQFTGIAGGITAEMVGAPAGSGSSTGNNTGDNAVNTRYDSLVSNATHTGEVTGSGALTITGKSITLSKMADIPARSLIGNAGNDAGDAAYLTLSAIKILLGLENVNNTDDLGKPPSTAVLALGTQVLEAAYAYTDQKTTTLLDVRPFYDANSGLFPAANGSGAGGAILKNDLFFLSVAGTIAGKDLAIGASLIALEDSPGQDSAKWHIAESTLDFIPEDVSRKVKSTDIIVTYDNDRYVSLDWVRIKLTYHALLTNFTPAQGEVTASDSILTAFQKLVANLAAWRVPANGTTGQLVGNLDGEPVWQNPPSYPSPVGKQSIAISATAWYPGTIPATMLGNAGSYSFSGTVDQDIIVKFSLPKSWDAGAISCVIKFTQDSTSAGAVVFALKAAAIGDGESSTPIYGAAVTVTKTAGTAGIEYHTAESSAVTVGNSPAKGDTLVLFLQRLPTNAGDTLGVGVYVQEIIIYYTTDAATDE